MLGLLLRRHTVPRLWLFALASWFAVVTVSAIALWHLYRNALDAQVREIGLLSMALTDEIDRGMHGVEEGLDALRDELSDGRLPVSGAEAEHLLMVRTRLMPLVQTLWLVDRKGRLLSASNKSPAPDPLSFSPQLDRLSDDGTTLSRPFMHIDGHESLVALAVRFDGSDGMVSGWIMAGIPTATLLSPLSAASPSTDAKMAVFRNDGAMLVGSLIASPMFDEATVAERMARQPSLEFHDFPDGTRRLVSLQSLPRYGLKTLFTRDMGVALKPWRDTMLGAVTSLLLLLAVLVAAVRHVVRADQRRAEAQQALQTQRSRASKFESLGTLAGGIAHDFNNVLAVILGVGEMALDATLPDSKQARYLDRMVQAALRGKALVERILAFSRGGAHMATVFEIQPIVEEALNLVMTSVRQDVVLERRLEAPGARLRGDPTQAFEGVMNLCINATQAMSGGGGVLSVQVGRAQIATSRGLSHGQLAAGDYVSLKVSDQGTGISPETMERLFEPFFTTRGAQSGVGLGLAVVHGVVAEFGGAIDVKTVLGRGSEFTLYLPECADAIAATEPLPKPMPTGSGQRVMIIDDEPALLLLGEEMLRQLGYAPVAYTDPVAALNTLRAETKRFAAVITDERMPALSGTQLTKALRKIAPDLPVLLISGYGGAGLASRAAAVGVTRVLSKPFQRAELAQALSELVHCEPKHQSSVCQKG